MFPTLVPSMYISLWDGPQNVNDPTKVHILDIREGNVLLVDELHSQVHSSQIAKQSKSKGPSGTFLINFPSSFPLEKALDKPSSLLVVFVVLPVLSTVQAP